MPKVSKNGNTPMNARIGIKYNGKLKPKISFSYPDKRTQMKGSYLYYLRLFSVCLFLLFFLGYELGNLIFDYTTFYGDDLLSRSYVNDTALREFTQCAATKSETITDWNKVRYDLCKPKKDLIYLNWGMVWFAGILTSVWLIIPAIIYYPLRKKWDKLYPKTAAFFSSRKFKTFKSKDIRFNEQYYIELPIFSNVVCDFKATKDFSRYLDKFEIKEYEFNYFEKKKIKIGKKSKKFYKKNEWIWYARWYFTNEPKSGELKVVFK
jgi:hypothetical protein